MKKLNVWGLAVTTGTVFGAGTLLLGWLAAIDPVVKIDSLISQFYIGYMPSFVGAIIGGMWAFVFWTIVGAIFASIYNWFVGEK